MAEPDTECNIPHEIVPDKNIYYNAYLVCINLLRMCSLVNFGFRITHTQDCTSTKSLRMDNIFKNESVKRASLFILSGVRNITKPYFNFIPQ